MAKNDIKTYKRSDVKPVVMTDAHKKDLHAREFTSNLVKYTLIVVVLLSLIFGMLSLFKVEVKDEKLNMIDKQYDRYTNQSAYNLISAWNAKASFTYGGDRFINEGYQYPHYFDYLVDSVPALRQAVNMGSVGADPIFEAIKPEQDKMLDMAYVAMLSFEIISLVWIAALAVIFVLSFIKKYAPSQTIINSSIIIHFVITAIMWIFTVVLAANSTKQFIFSVGVGMWLNLLVATIAVFFVIFNFIYQAKVKAHEKEMN